MITLSSAAAAIALMLGGQTPSDQWAQPQRVAPRGSYAQSCREAYVNQGRLYADCRDTRGTWRGASIDLSRCTDSDIANDNGLLVCGNRRGDYEDDRRGDDRYGDDRYGRDRDGWGGDERQRDRWGWEGGGGRGRSVIIVYRDADFRGRSTSFRGAVPNLADTGFNDSISSMEFRGEWLACTDRNYRGQCQLFRNSVRNLDRWGLNDRISSLRPAGRGDPRY